MRFQYGDLLRYPEEMDTDGLYRFMFLQADQGGSDRESFHRVMVVQCPDQDDLWYPGSIILTGEFELVRAFDD